MFASLELSFAEPYIWTRLSFHQRDGPWQERMFASFLFALFVRKWSNFQTCVHKSSPAGHLLSLTVLEGEGSAEHVVGLVYREEVKEDQAGLHYQGGVRLFILKWESCICNSPILYDFNLNSYMRSEDKGGTKFFYCPQSPRLARVLNAQAQMGGAVGATERDSD